jgi:hypothetical protein
MNTIVIDEYDWPRCAKCEMPVEKFCVTDTGDALILMAACHGKEETVVLPDTIMDDITSTLDITIGPAFATGD